MNLSLTSIKEFLSSKLLIQFYFIFFIFLNIIDFLNYLEGDLDFFKKLLSWIIIAYIFYKVSFTKIFIGKRNRLYDILLIIAFSLMSIVKSLILYIKDNNINQDFFIFQGVLKLIVSIDATVLLNSSFILGLILSVILSIIVYSRYGASKNSFAGSFDIVGKKKYLMEFLLVLFSSTFFGLIIFNFFI